MEAAPRNRRLSSARMSIAPLTAIGGDTKMNATMIAAMYSKILKMSNENKITTKNTWSLPLIDHMDELISEDMNFQKASCALDASVQIYSSRVDDVWTTSFRVLENLNRTEAKPSEAEMETNKGVSRKLCATETLEANLSNITVKKFDMDFDVDPMFHKMSKNFDEGGARGMLLNQLSVQEGCRLAFDSVDVADVDGQVHVGASGAAPDTAERVDCREFSSKLAAVLEHRLCPQLGLLYDKLEANGIDTAATANWQDVSMVGPASPVCAPCSVAPRTSNASAATTGVAPRAVHFDDSVAAPAGEASLLMPVDVDDITLGGELGDGNASDDNDVGGEGMNYSAMSAPSLNAEEQAEIDDAKQLLEGNGLPFVDAALLREFLRPAVKQVVKEKKARERKTKAALAAAEKAKAKAKAKGKGRGKDADGAAAPRARKEKTVFTVDFSAPSPDDDAFAAPRAAKSTQLSDAAVRRAALADDAFLLPSDAVVDDSDVDVDASTMTAGATGGIRRGSGGSGGHEMGDGDSDDGGGGAFGGYDSDGPVAAVDSSTWADTTTWVKPPPGVDLSEIHYSRVAKTVDVLKLKADMWNCVASNAPVAAGSENDRAAGNTAPKPIVVDGCRDRTLVGCGDGISFQDIIKHVAPGESADVTTPFYFVCMLHLANEHGLTLQGSTTLKDFRVYHSTVA